MKKSSKLLLLVLISFALFSFASCRMRGEESGVKENKIEEKIAVQTYKQITPQEAKKLMDTEEDYIIIDARTEEEFLEGHIPGAVVLSYEETAEKAGEIVPEKDKLILIYCRSGRRSKIAAETLVSLGYTNVKEFGGIIGWPYETVKE